MENGHIAQDPLRTRAQTFHAGNSVLAKAEFFQRPAVGYTADQCKKPMECSN
ncbi:hypothetical protein VCB98_02670 [Gammaproteobacteria bacterium AB-CW1]|uniref:Uncharacterized protein n=1 Tax=Natronospira elongata TaxID=3110268 RepID=A0AAP6MM16_9GAMM|nr:hypothetical protein [Gammaproteobacteria bacterium AB-CW1]